MQTNDFVFVLNILFYLSLAAAVSILHSHFCDQKNVRVKREK